jgi:hypothetical protein
MEERNGRTKENRCKEIALISHIQLTLTTWPWKGNRLLHGANTEIRLTWKSRFERTDISCFDLSIRVCVLLFLGDRRLWRRYKFWWRWEYVLRFLALIYLFLSDYRGICFGGRYADMTAYCHVEYLMSFRAVVLNFCQTAVRKILFSIRRGPGIIDARARRWRNTGLEDIWHAFIDFITIR